MKRDIPSVSVTVIGLGRIGCVTAACLAATGHRVIGVDTDDGKVTSIAQGRSPFHEDHLDEVLAEAHREERLSVSTDLRAALAVSSMAIVCISGDWSSGDQSDHSGLLNLFDEIVAAQQEGIFQGIIVLRCTVPPGTCEQKLLPRLKGSGLGLVCNPEFLREGSAVEDFLHPSLLVIGSQDQKLSRSVAALYETLPCDISYVNLREAEIIKHSCNAFHALKICFANEIGALCGALGVSGSAVMEVLRSDTRLNASAAYLRPGFAFGGYCLPKETRALNHGAEQMGIVLPLLRSILPSNLEHLDRAVDAVIDQGKHRIGVYGITFKSGTGDLRSSPALHLVQKLLAQGFDVRIFDELIGSTQLESSLEDLDEEIRARLTTNRESWLQSIECAALTQQPEARFLQRMRDGGMPVLDLSQATPFRRKSNSFALSSHAGIEHPPDGPLHIDALASTHIDLSVIVPTYKEEGNIGSFLTALCESLDLVLPGTYRILVVDDNSPDKTLEEATEIAEQRPQIRLVRRRGKRELSTAVIRGWQMARGRVLATINADFQHPPSLVAEMWRQMRDHDLVVASRYCPGGSVGDWPLSRRILSRSAQKLGEWMLPEVHKKVSDPLSGCFMVRREALKGVELKPIGYKSLIEVLVRGRAQRIAEVPYRMQRRTRGSSKANSARSLDYIFQLWQLRAAWRQANS